MPKFFDPTYEPVTIRNPRVIEVRVGCVNHPDAPMCIVIKDTDAGAVYHFATIAVDVVTPVDVQCPKCGREDGRCEFMSRSVWEAVVAANPQMTPEEIHRRAESLFDAQLSRRTDARSNARHPEG